MKIMIRFFAVAVLMGFVVGLQGSQQIKVPDSLPIGTGFPPANTSIRIDIGFNDPGGYPLHTNIPYEATMGSLEEAVRTQVGHLLKRFVPRAGMETYEYAIDVGVDYVIPEKSELPPMPIGWSHGFDNLYKLVQVNGKWTFPADAADKVKLGYQSFLGIYAKGLTEVQLTKTDELGNEFETEVSPNGITDKTCSEYPGGSAYLGPDILKVSIGYAYPDYYVREYPDYTPQHGYYYLTFGAAKATWAKYDLETGKKLASNEPVPAPFKLAINLVQLDETGKISLLSRNSLRWGLKLSVTGPLRPATIEYTDAIGGKWAKLTELPMTYNRSLSTGTGEFVEPLSTGSARFYRAR